jgi:hypothetical protein
LVEAQVQPLCFVHAPPPGDAGTLFVGSVAAGRQLEARAERIGPPVGDANATRHA